MAIIIREDLIISENVTYADDLQIASGVTLKINSGSTLTMKNVNGRIGNIENFGTIELAGEESDYATIHNGQIETYENAKIKSNYGEFYNTNLSGRSNNFLEINESLLISSSVRGFSSLSIDDSLIIESGPFNLSADVEISKSTFINPKINISYRTSASFSDCNFIVNLDANDLGEKGIISVSSGDLHGSSLIISDTFLKYPLDLDFEDLFYDSDLLVELDISENSFVNDFNFIDTNSNELTIGRYSFNPNNTNLLASGTDGDDEIFGSPYGETINSGAGKDKIYGSHENDIIYSEGGNDTIYGEEGDDIIYGGSGIDTAIFMSMRDDYEISFNGESYVVNNENNFMPSFFNRDGVDIVYDVERLSFTDSNIALDINGNAGDVAKILGVTFGPESILNQEYVGIGMSYRDADMSYEDLAALAIDVTGATTNEAVVSTLWNNLFNALPSPADAAPYVAMLDDGNMTRGELTVLAADLELNQDNIGLNGLMQTGLEYIPYA